LPGYALNAASGSGWSLSQEPRLVPAGANTVVAIADGTTSRYFDLVGGAYQGRSFDTARLSYDGGSDTFTLTDSSGQVWTYLGFGATRPAAARGSFTQVTDAAGQVTAVTARTPLGRIAEVQRVEGSVTESYLSSYLPGSDANAGLLADVTLR
jgi:hypothetical protein